jgi:hypothetical protein
VGNGIARDGGVAVGVVIDRIIILTQSRQAAKKISLDRMNMIYMIWDHN